MVKGPYDPPLKKLVECMCTCKKDKKDSDYGWSEACDVDRGTVRRYRKFPNYQRELNQHLAEKCGRKAERVCIKWGLKADPDLETVKRYLKAKFERLACEEELGNMIEAVNGVQSLHPQQ